MLKNKNSEINDIKNKQTTTKIVRRIDESKSWFFGKITLDPTNQKKDLPNYHSHKNRETLQQTPKKKNTEYDNISYRGILHNCTNSIKLEKSKRSRLVSRLIQNTRLKPRRDQYFNRSITSKKIKIIIKCLSTKTAQAQMESQ